MNKTELISKLQWRGWLLGVGYVLVALFLAKLVVAWPLWIGFITICFGYIVVQWWYDSQVRKLVARLDA